MSRVNVLAEIDSLLGENFGKEVFTPGLERIGFWIRHYELETNAEVITICGTNGKGETTCAVSFLMQNHGMSYCSWTSPHILEITERFVSNGCQIEPNELLSLIRRWLPRLELHKNAPLSYFEFLFVLFLDWQKNLKPKYLVLEVGLGGRLDAVNALDANVVLLTSISRDHQEFLGNRLENILREKLGVLRPNSHLVANLELKYLQQKAKNYCKQLGAHLEFIIGNAGDFSSGNRRLALAGFRLLTGSDAKQEKLNTFHYRARYSVQFGYAQIELYGSHNPDGLRKLVGYLKSQHYNNYDVVLLSFSKRDERDLVAMVKIASGLGKEVWLSSFSHYKAVELQKLHDILNEETKGRINFVSDYKELLQSKTEFPQKILVTGSYYFIGDVLSWIKSVGPK